MSIRILPSLASADQLNLGDAVARSGPNVHLDIEDGNFVPNITFGIRTVSAVCDAAAGKTIDVHLLVTNPKDYLTELAGLGIHAVCAHVEALPYPLLFLNTAKKLGMRAGLAVNISTSLDIIRALAEEMDYVLLMTAEPDGLGNRLNPYALRRAMEFSAEKSVPVIADGGLDEEAVQMLDKSGAYAAVLGRSFFSKGEQDENR